MQAWKFLFSEIDKIGASIIVCDTLKTWTYFINYALIITCRGPYSIFSMHHDLNKPGLANMFCHCYVSAKVRTHVGF